MIRGLRKLGRVRNFALVLGSGLVIVAALAGDSLEPLPRAWLLTIGFGLLALALIATGRKLVLSQLLALTLIVFCGASALVAVPQSASELNENARGLTQEQVEASIPSDEINAVPTPEGFHEAALITGVGGLSLFWTVLLLSIRNRPDPERRNRTPQTLLRTGKLLVFIGFLGVFAALLRFALTQLPSDDLFGSLKSFWIGGTALLLIATSAVPGFALWFQGLVGTRAERRGYWQLALLALVWTGLLVPTGQRGFLIALGLMFLAVLLGNRMIKTRTAAVLILAGVLFIGLTQALRNEAREDGQVTFSGFLERVSPNEWQDLYGSQIASFNWTVIIAQNRDRLEIPNSYVALLEKPIPRSILPEKSQGFGAEFTEQAFPGAFEQDVSFAVPYFAEAEFNLGLAGLVLASIFLGVVAWAADRWFARRGPPLVEPVVLATIFWFLFEMIRGDTANALVFAGAWIIPLVLFSRAIGLRDHPRPRRLVIDATQVPVHFSGIGRRIFEIGESLCEQPLALPVEVLCGRDAQKMFADVFPADVRFRTPIRSSRPRIWRILFQQIVIPIRFRAKTVLLSPGDQAPIWGSSPLIFVIHDTRRIDMPESAAGSREASYYRFLMSVGAHRASAIITISRFSESRIRDLFDPFCSIEIVATHPRSREPVEEAAIRDAAPSFLVLGAVRRYKGIETIARAILKIDESNGSTTPGVHFVGEIEASLPAEIANELSSRMDGEVRFEGWLEDGEVADLARGLAGAIHASEYEGYGLPVAETLAMGLPTIASDIPPHREIGDDAVHYFPVGDASALAVLVERLAADPELRIEMARSARRRAQDLRQTGETWSEVLESSVENACIP